MRVTCDASTVKREKGTVKVPVASSHGDRVWRRGGFRGWMGQPELCPTGDAEENPAAVEGLLLLQHSREWEKGGSEGRCGSRAAQMPNLEPAGSCGTDSSSPRQRTASLSKLYQNMQENPELRDPVARARVKLGKGWEGGDGGVVNGKDFNDSIYRIGEWMHESWGKVSEDIIHDVVHGVPGMVDVVPFGTGRGESFYRGVYMHKNMPSPYSVIKYLTKQHFLGYFRNVLEAARAWDLAALKRAMTSRTPLSKAKLNYPLQEYLDNQSLVTALVQHTFVEVVAKLRNASNVGRSEYETKLEELLEGRDIPESDDQEGNVQRQSRPQDCIETNKTHVQGNEVNGGSRQEVDTALVRKSVRQLRTLCSGPRSAQNTWIKRLRDDHKFKGVYFSRDGVPYSKVELEGKYHYLGRFDTIEEAARAYDLATLKRAMLHTQSSVSLNFPPGDYTQDVELMDFIQTSSCGEVAQFIRNLAQNRRGTKGGEVVSQYPHGLLFRNFKTGMLSRGPHLSIKRTGSSGTLCSECQCVKDISSHSELRKSGMERVSVRKPSSLSFPVSGRGVCDGKVYKRVSEKDGWVQVGVNTFAVELTWQCCCNSDAIKRIPDAMAMWFTGFLERCGSHEIQVIDAEFNRSYNLTISTQDNGVRFTSGWGKFVKEAQLQSGEILIFIKTDCAQKLRYTVAMPYKDTQVLTRTESVGPQQIILSPPTLPKFPMMDNSIAVTHSHKKGRPHAFQKPPGNCTQSMVLTTAQDKAMFADYTSDPSSSSVHSASAYLSEQGNGALQEAGLSYPTGDLPGTDTKHSPPMHISRPVHTCASVISESGTMAYTTHGTQNPHHMVTSKVPVTSSTSLCGTPERPCGKMYLVSDINGQVRLVDEEGQIVNTSGTIVVNRNGHAVLSPKIDTSFHHHKVVSSSETEKAGEWHESTNPTCHARKKVRICNQGGNIKSVHKAELSQENAKSNQLASECRKSQRDMALCRSPAISEVDGSSPNRSSSGPPNDATIGDWGPEVLEALSSCKGLSNRIIRKLAHEMNKEQEGASILELIALSKSGKHEEIVKQVEESIVSM